MYEEKELKGMISRATYNKLSSGKWDKEIVQINFYYGNPKTINSDITIRVRCLQNHFYLQIKLKNNMYDGVRISREYEQKLSSIPKLICEDTLRNMCCDYSHGDVDLMGFLVTQRKIKQVKDIEIALDKNMYSGKTDYEIEFEYKSGIEDVNKLIHYMELTNHLHKGKSKFERFIERLKDLNDGANQQ